MSDYILALDQGTTSSRAVVYDRSGSAIATGQHAFEQRFPNPGWVEHDPIDIWDTQLSAAHDAIAAAQIPARDIAAIGITNQRETVVVWDKRTGTPIYNAIVWQDRRTADQTDLLKSPDTASMIRERTGLMPDPYFSASKIRWILDHVDGAQGAAQDGHLAVGTIDSWLVWCLSGGTIHVTDVSNASRTMLFDIHQAVWDSDLLALFDIPRSMLPGVVDSSGLVGTTDPLLFGSKISIAGIAGDQQASLLGQLCTKPGMVKTTYGTGCFMLVHTGENAVLSESGLLTTVAWRLKQQPIQYALEGSVFVGGSAVQWLRDGLGIIESDADVDKLAASVADSGGVVVVSAFAGLGAPYWDAHARGAILGITRGTTGAHIARATLEGVAFRVSEVLEAMERDLGHTLHDFRVDGGAAASNVLMQMQADAMGGIVRRPCYLETTALGASYLAGLGIDLWPSVDTLSQRWELDREFSPETDAASREVMRTQWLGAVERAQGWAP